MISGSTPRNLRIAQSFVIGMMHGLSITGLALNLYVLYEIIHPGSIFDAAPVFTVVLVLGTFLAFLQLLVIQIKHYHTND